MEVPQYLDGLQWNLAKIDDFFGIPMLGDHQTTKRWIFHIRLLRTAGFSRLDERVGGLHDTLTRCAIKPGCTYLCKYACKTTPTLRNESR